MSSPTLDASAATLPCRTVILVENVKEGMPKPEHFRVEDSTVSTALEAEGDILVQALCFSADPYLRGMIKMGERVKPGAPMQVFISGKVLKSRNPKWAAGDLFGTNAAASTVQVLKGDRPGHVWKLSDYITEDQISYGVGVLGMPGATAYGGLIDVLRPGDTQSGDPRDPPGPEVIFISAASGAVGGLVGQIAKNNYGCRTIGSAGGPEKGKILLERLGFDHHIDYKGLSTKEELVERIRAVAPDGIDMYFENVGGIHFDAAYATLRKDGRIAVCGGISNYNRATGDPASNNGVNLMQTVYNFQRIEGFVCGPWLSGRKGKFLPDMSKWLKEGKVKVEETFFDGIENWFSGFQSLFTGENKGKVVVRV